MKKIMSGGPLIPHKPPRNPDRNPMESVQVAIRNTTAIPNPVIDTPTLPRNLAKDSTR